LPGAEKIGNHMISLSSPISNLSGIGEKSSQALKKLGILTIRDLIFYFPTRHQDFSHITSIASIEPGVQVTIEGKIVLIANRRSKRKRMIVTEGLIDDGCGQLKVIWFNQGYLLKNIHVGDTLRFAGTVSDSLFDLQLVNPSYEKVGLHKDFVHTGRIVPLYPLGTAISQKQFRSTVKAALDLIETLNEWLPKKIMDTESLLDFDTAIRTLHFPESQEEFLKAKDRLSFDELFLYQLKMVFGRSELTTMNAPQIPFQKSVSASFISTLPFELTKDQKKCAWEIIQDCVKPLPMNRLLQGDVGSGKTIVAGLAALGVLLHGYQVVYMAPTEILARQHFETFLKWFEPLGITLELLTSKKKVKYEEIEKGTYQLIIGTHALLNKKVHFKNLALVIIDEQHRFGVAQRKMLRESNALCSTPHLLSLTATPIPRTLCLTLYGDLDISFLGTIPTGRKRTITKVVPHDFRDWTYEFIKKQLTSGRQAFVICPTIDPSDFLNTRSVKEEYERLSRELFKQFRVGLLHGAMKQKDKEDVMKKMIEHELDMLVTTSVIEVGIDIPNATMMIIEGAEMFGLAQLHQLRGRVGRSHHQSYCFLFPTNESQSGNARLQALVQSHDGQVLAEMDLKLRGQGDLLGFQQSGMVHFKIASLGDVELLKKTHRWAKIIMDEIDVYPALKKKLEEQSESIHPE